MTDRVTLLDTGPLVALLKRDERHHGWTVDAFGALSGRLVTCEAVLTEAFYLLRRWPDAIDAVLDRVASGRLEVQPVASDTEPVRALLLKYRDVPMSFADACLVRLAERFPRAVVLTLDSDFRVYRKRDRRVIPLLAPESP